MDQYLAANQQQGRTHRGILVKLVGSDVVDGEHNLDVALLGLLDQRSDLLGSGRIEEGLADLE